MADTLIIGLDTFIGELSENDYLAVDNGTSTSKVNSIKASRSGYGGVIASLYASDTYSVGDYVIHGGLLYKCITDIPTAEEWTASHWEQVILADDIIEYVDTEVKASESYLGENILPTDTASGAIASFSDGTDLVPAKSLQVTLDPIQDLHGYDKPWSGGAGVNKFNKATVGEGYIRDVDGTVNGSAPYMHTDYIPVTPNATYYVKTDQTNGGWGAWYDSNKEYISSASGWMNNTLTAPSNAYYLRLTCVSNISGNIDTFAVNYPSTVTTYAPYSNICPISGRTEVVTEVCGKNLFSGQPQNGYSNPVPLVVGQTYTASAKRIESVETYCYLKERNTSTQEETNHYLIANTIVTPYTFTTRIGYEYYIWCNSTYTNVKEVQIELGSTATDYEPYHGDTYSTDLGRTVYGGQLDVVSGELVVTDAPLVFDGTAWTYNSGGFFYKIVLNAGTVVSDYYMTENGITMYLNGNNGQARIYLNDNPFLTSESDVGAMLNGYKLLYELATPQTYQLTPTEVSLLLGNNNVWSDGDVTVVYNADIQRWVEKKLS